MTRAAGSTSPKGTNRLTLGTLPLQDKIGARKIQAPAITIHQILLINAF